MGVECGMTQEPDIEEAYHSQILKVAADSVAHGVERGEPLVVEPADYPPPLQLPRAVFVTLTIGERLRGCIGTLESLRPLIVNTADYAFAAAFRDSRFPAVTRSECPKLHYHVSVLSPPEALPCDSEADLIAKIRPGIDGLILEDGCCRGTFLPSVWEDITDPAEFVRRLKIKAGLPASGWSETMTVRRYTAQSIG